uniref:hydrocephalus-inducing protein homolog n=1 Tax=Myxine glutinosa TaxID=7769 RepID=UPI00358F8698
MAADVVTCAVRNVSNSKSHVKGMKTDEIHCKLSALLDAECRSLFFALPLTHCSGLLYNLDGAVQAPAPVCTITRNVLCQETYTETLPIENCLPKSQRFHLVIEMAKPVKLSSATKLYGVDFVDVGATGRRDFKIHFFSYKEGTFTAKVIFLNKETQEFIFFMLIFHATSTDVVPVLELSATVQHGASTSLVLHNPLAVPVTFNTDCDLDEVKLPPQFVVPAESKASISLEYRLMHAGNAERELSFHSNNLCSINYDLRLDVRAAPPERTLYFKAALGCIHVQAASFLHYLSQKTEYTCK